MCQSFICFFFLFLYHSVSKNALSNSFSLSLSLSLSIYLSRFTIFLILLSFTSTSYNQLFTRQFLTEQHKPQNIQAVISFPIALINESYFLPFSSFIVNIFYPFILVLNLPIAIRRSFCPFVILFRIHWIQRQDINYGFKN